MSKTAFITGITGPGRLIPRRVSARERLRRSWDDPRASFNTSRIDHLYWTRTIRRRGLRLHFGDLTDGTGIRSILERVQPDEVYNIGAQSHVRVSFDIPEYTGRRGGDGARCGILEAMRDICSTRARRCASTKLGSSEMFGKVQELPQTEQTPFYPRSARMAVSKAYAYWLRSITARPTACTPATAFCSTTSRPGAARRSSRARSPVRADRIKLGLQDELFLGNLDARRDWGYAKEYVETMWLMLQQDKPDDSSSRRTKPHTREGIHRRGLRASGLGLAEFTSPTIPRDQRPAEVDLLIGNADKAKAPAGLGAQGSVQRVGQDHDRADLEIAREEARIANRTE